MGKEGTNPLVLELTRGKELAEQLMVSIDETGSSLRTREILVEGLLRSYETALSMLNRGDPVKDSFPAGPKSIAKFSPRGRSSAEDQCAKNVYKKRKMSPNSHEKVRGCSELICDGRTWRKYGQKYILGANYPRAYFRCTHRDVRGCLATKQVQRSDEDPTIFEVTYKGRHTCNESSQFSRAMASAGTESECNRAEVMGEKQQIEEPYFGFVTTHEAAERLDVFPSFPHPPATMEAGSFEGRFVKEEDFVGSLSPGFLPPNLQISQSDHAGTMLATDSVPDTPVGDGNDFLNRAIFDANFTIDFIESELFSWCN